MAYRRASRLVDRIRVAQVEIGALVTRLLILHTTVGINEYGAQIMTPAYEN